MPALEPNPAPVDVMYEEEFPLRKLSGIWSKNWTMVLQILYLIRVCPKTGFSKIYLPFAQGAANFPKPGPLI
jgi:hypothetical protein